MFTARAEAKRLSWREFVNFSVWHGQQSHFTSNAWNPMLPLSFVRFMVISARIAKGDSIPKLCSNKEKVKVSTKNKDGINIWIYNYSGCHVQQLSAFGKNSLKTAGDVYVWRILSCRVKHSCGWIQHGDDADWSWNHYYFSWFCCCCQA